MRPSTWKILILSALLPAAAVRAHDHHGHGFNINVRGHGEPRDCSDIQIDAGRREVATSEQSLTVRRGAQPLKVRAATNSGVIVRGGTGDSFEVTVCKGATAGDRAEADARLAQVSVRLEGNELVTSGPADSDWIAYLLVRAPRDAAMDLEIENGPLSVAEISGHFDIRGKNGPVSLHAVSGDVSVDLRNGPVSVDGGGGKMRVHTQNGPISVSLEGADWDGEGLEAEAVNGPLSLDLDDSYRGGGPSRLSWKSEDGVTSC